MPFFVVLSMETSNIALATRSKSLWAHEKPQTDADSAYVCAAQLPRSLVGCEAVVAFRTYPILAVRVPFAVPG